LENYWLLPEKQPAIGGALSCQRMLAFFFKVNLLKDAGRIAHLNGGLDFIGVVVLRRFADYPEKKRQTYLQSYSCTFSDHSYSESMFHFQFPFYFQLTVALRRLTYNSRI